MNKTMSSSSEIKQKGNHKQSNWTTPISPKPEKPMTTHCSKLILRGLIWCSIASLCITVSTGGEFTESESFSNFITALDPQNESKIVSDEYMQNPCLDNVPGIKCNPEGTNVVEIRLQDRNLSGRIDGDSLCKLKKLRILDLSRNRIQGDLPSSVTCFPSLIYLNLTGNNLSGKFPPKVISKLENFDASGLNRRFRFFIKEGNGTNVDSETEHKKSPGIERRGGFLLIGIPLLLGLIFTLLFAHFMHKRAQRAKAEAKAKAVQEKKLSHDKGKVIMILPDVQSELVFFVDKPETFSLEDLLEATADLTREGYCSNLYKVVLKNGSVYAVKRLKLLQVSFQEFGKIMRQIGNLKHPNILPLIGFNSTNEEKLLIYKYQSNGSLLKLLESYIDGKKEFPWKLRLSIVHGIAKGLDYIYRKSNNIMPHENLKLSNILLDENHSPLISEYGYSKFLDPKSSDKSVSEQSDVYSFGIIILELLTAKPVEKTGIDLPKWVNAMVREEWTGEVFDKEITKDGKQFAFPLLNVALQCVAKTCKEIPTVAEVLENIQEIVQGIEQNNEFQDNSMSLSSIGSMGSSLQDCCLLHTVIPETWDTPASNY